jgi:hypothetical protein
MQACSAAHRLRPNYTEPHKMRRDSGGASHGGTASEGCYVGGGTRPRRPPRSPRAPSALRSIRRVHSNDFVASLNVPQFKAFCHGKVGVGKQRCSGRCAFGCPPSPKKAPGSCQGPVDQLPAHSTGQSDDDAVVCGPTVGRVIESHPTVLRRASAFGRGRASHDGPTIHARGTPAPMMERAGSWRRPMASAGAGQTCGLGRQVSLTAGDAPGDPSRVWLGWCAISAAYNTAVSGGRRRARRP